MGVIEWIELGQNKDGTHSIMCSICGGKLKSKGHARSIHTREHFVYCPYCGVRHSQINTIENTNDKQSKEAIKEIVKDYITATYGSIDNL